MKNLKLIVRDTSDPSVGLFPAKYEIDCPFHNDEVDDQTLEWFKNTIKDIYMQFATGKIVVEYDSKNYDD